jgi:3-deoxy-8-phosphooctulonate synthase
VLTDIHEPSQAEAAAEAADVLQIPGVLVPPNRSADGRRAHRPRVNIKKGQFVSPYDIRHAADKVASTGNNNILLTERGSSFGYNNLVVDMRGLEIMREFGWPVIFDATHSVQIPGWSGPRFRRDSRSLFQRWPARRWRPEWTASSWKFTKILSEPCPTDRMRCAWTDRLTAGS